MYFRRVFVGLDLELHDLTSEEFVPATARRLVERGIELAVAQRGELHLCAVIDGLDLTRVSATPQQISAFGGILSERLDALADEAREAGIDCETSLLGGRAWEELLRQASEWSANLIVLGAGSQPSQLGPTALKVMRSAKCPVLLERSEVSGQKSEVRDEGEPPHVLIADDLSDACGEMLMTIVGSGLWRDAKCWLTHVVEPDHWPEAWRGGLADDDLTRRQAARVESARLRLHEQLAPTDHRTMTYGILAQVVDGEFSATLRRLIDEWQIDLLVCGSGSQMDAVLPHVLCSVRCFPGQACR
ncbi:MAG: universal stress protein, partial [Planctomycetaceae bacterium]|nr:universal stress protein [Planctomycetaceae bacterium]